jgi:hypothetical protein
MQEIPTDRLSLVIGVTGHRDVAAADEAPLRAAFGRVIDELSRACPHTPLLVLSGLAAGADAVAAEEAIARNIPVMAVLPMPVAEYERDFSPDQLARFHTLLQASARVVVASQVRENGYVATGRFIAQYSHLVVAFWDGRTGRGAGGTADVVAMRLGGEDREEIESVPYLPDIGPVDQIVTPRAGAPRPDDAFAVHRRYPRLFLRHGDAERTFARTLAAVDVYNQDLSHTPGARAASALDRLMERTDATANRLQRSTNRFQGILLICAFAVAGVQFVTHFAEIWKVAALLVAFLVYAWARKHDYENRYQDYRAIAEALRVQEAWRAAGLTGRLVDHAYLKMQEGDLQWIRMALRSFYLVACEGAGTQSEPPDPFARAWVRSQWRYYYAASRAQARSRLLLDRIGRAAVAVGIACTLGSLAVLVADHQWYCALIGNGCPPEAVLARTHFAIYANLLTVPVALAAVLIALFDSYAERQSLGPNARRYERMFRVFDRARRTLLRIAAGKPGDPKSVLYELGRAALVEHADWLIMRRERPLKVVLL